MLLWKALGLLAFVYVLESSDICTTPVGISDTSKISDYQLTASSFYGTRNQASYGRLNGNRGDGWCAKEATGNNDWLQVDLGKTVQVCAVATQGDINGNEWTTVFKLSYSSDGNTWTTYKYSNGREAEFHRSGDSNTIDKHLLPVTVKTRYIRFHPFKQHNWNCLRVEVYITGCNETLTGVMGTFHSPNYPRKYPGGQYCSWRITVSPAQQIYLTFTDFSLQTENYTDTLYVYDIQNTTEEVLGVFNGGHPPPKEGIYSSSNHMFIIFKSDKNYSYTGFSAFYCEGECHESLDWPEGSYGIPKTASGCPYADFQWLIGWRYQDTENNNPSNRKSSKLHLDAKVSSNDIERSFCVKANTSIDTKRRHWPQGKYCIYKKCGSCPNNFSTGFIKWDDENNNNHNSMSGTLPDGVYDTDTKIEFCCRTDGDKKDPISLPTLKPFFLLAYDSAECQQVKWAVVSVEWIRYDNEDTGNKDGKGGSYPYGAGISDHKIHYCYYQGCNESLRGVMGTFHSPNYPWKYPDGQYCSWRITVDPAQQIHLKFTNFSLQNENNTDALYVYDGRDSSGKVLGVFYGGNPPSKEGIHSSSNHMFVIFISDKSASYTGFNAFYCEGRCSTCQEPLGMENGAISDAQIRASSQWDHRQAARNARLNVKRQESVWGWATGTNNHYQWLQVDLGSYTSVAGVATQGGSDDPYDNWVTKYSLQYSDDGVTRYIYKGTSHSTSKVFDGNVDADSIVYNRISPPITARYIRILPLQWQRHIGMRIELYGCPVLVTASPITKLAITPSKTELTIASSVIDLGVVYPGLAVIAGCTAPLGMENGAISDAQMSASSQWNDKHAARNARLNFKRQGAFGWKTLTNGLNQWLQVELDGYTTVTGVATQGTTDNKTNQWVTKYWLQYSDDGENFNLYKEPRDNSPKVFVGNTDSDHIVYNKINPPIETSYVRILPVQWETHIGMRIELYGCGSDTPSSETTLEWYSIVGPLSAVIFLALLAWYICKRQKKDRDKPEIKSSRHNEEQEYEMDVWDREVDEWEISRERITLREVIGSGAYGMVWRATLSQPTGGFGKRIVAAKCFTPTAGEDGRKALMREIELGKMFGKNPQPNIINFIGCVTTQLHPILIMEYLASGDLLGYLRKSRGIVDKYHFGEGGTLHLTTYDLVSFAKQIASGMVFLGSRGIVHRDLAARNVLLDRNFVCKVTDFGLAYQNFKYGHGNAKKGCMPIKWTAPEILFGNPAALSSKSDVWSYGIVLYEIFTIGGIPYPDWSEAKTMTEIRNGYRMPKPPHINDTLYHLMERCWNWNPVFRPPFEKIRQRMQTYIEKKMYLDLMDMSAYDAAKYSKVADVGEAAGENEKPALPPRKKVSPRRKWSSLRDQRNYGFQPPAGADRVGCST